MMRAIRFQILLLIISTCIFSTSISANDYESFQKNDIVYSIIDAHTVEVSGYTRNQKEVKIPADVNGYRVTVIGKRAFFYNDIKRIILPETVEKIADEAFAGSALEDINIPMSVHEVGYLAFQLTPIFEQNIEDGVSYIDGICVGGEKDGLLEVVTEDELVTIDIRLNTRLISNYAFIRNMYIAEVNIPSSVEYIGQGAFYQCENLRSVNIASKVNVSSYAFDECKNLKELSGYKAYLESDTGFKQTPLRTKLIAKKVGGIGSICALVLAIAGIVFRILLKNRGGQKHRKE